MGDLGREGGREGEREGGRGTYVWQVGDVEFGMLVVLGGRASDRHLQGGFMMGTRNTC